MAFKDTYPFLAMGGKIDPLSEVYGAGLITSGSVFYVKNSTDSDYTTFKDRVGADVVFNDIQSAINKCKSDRNDYVFVCPKEDGSVWALGTALDVNKDRVHLISMGYTKARGGYSNVLQGYVSATGVDTSIVDVTGAGCEIAGFHIKGTCGTAALGTISGGLLRLGTASTGTAHSTWVHDCKIESTSAISQSEDIVTISSTVAAGVDGNRFDDCWIGNAGADPISAAKVNGGTSGPINTEFHNCQFVVNSGSTTDAIVTMGTGATKWTLFNQCDFVNLDQTNKPASALTGAVKADNMVLLRYCTGVNVTDFGTDTEVMVAPAESGTIQKAYNPGLAIGSALVVAA